MQQNLEIIKGLLDAAIQKGVFANAESVISVTNAFIAIAEQLHKKDLENGNNTTNN